MIQPIFRVVDRSCGILQCKQESLIPNTTADKKLNTVVDKTVNTDKERDIVANKNLNTVADKGINANKKQDALAGKEPNAVAKLSIVIKDQITRRMKLGD